MRLGHDSGSKIEGPRSLQVTATAVTELQSLNPVVAFTDELFLNKTPSQPGPALPLTGFVESQVLAETAHVGAIEIIQMRQQRCGLARPIPSLG